jgi:hypothetical protein
MPSDQCHQGPLQFVSSSESYTIVKGEKEAWEITKLQLYDYTPKASLLLQVSNMNLPKNPKHERWYQNVHKLLDMQNHKPNCGNTAT